MTDFEYFSRYSRDQNGRLSVLRILRGLVAVSATLALTLYGVTGACIEAMCRRWSPHDMEDTISYRIAEELAARVSNWYERYPCESLH